LNTSCLRLDAEVGTREFNSIFFQQVFAYPTYFVPPMEIIQHPANTGFMHLENSFLSITAAVTATMAVNVNAVQWAILKLTPDSQLSVNN